MMGVSGSNTSFFKMYNILTLFLPGSLNLSLNSISLGTVFHTVCLDTLLTLVRGTPSSESESLMLTKMWTLAGEDRVS